MQRAARGGDETVQLRQFEEIADQADAASAALLKGDDSGGNDAAENQVARSGAEERVNGVVRSRGELALPVVERGVGDAFLFGNLPLGSWVEAENLSRVSRMSARDQRKGSCWGEAPGVG